MTEIEKLYLESDRDLRIKRSMLGCVLCIFFVPLGAIVDYFLYNELLLTFLIGRFICSILIVFILSILFFEIGKRNVKILTMLWLLFVIITMCWIIYSTDKYASTYYASLSVFIFSVAVIIPLSTKEMLYFCTITIILYLFSSLTFPLENRNILFNNLYFICLTSVISTISIFLNSKYRFKEFSLNYELKMAISNLKSTRDQLIQSEKINAIGSLSAGLLHEVNNPLNYTMTALQLIKMDPAVNADEDLKDTVKDIEEGMTRIKNIVSDLRAFAYPEEADKTVQFPIREAVESALRFTASENKDIEKIVNVSSDLIVSASKTHIVQVLINLVSNATKAINKADREKGVIKIDAIEENGRIKISVSDNGTGMNEETLRKVFDPFFTTNEVGKGMGLGLSVSHTIIKNHGGNLSAESVFGEGSKFYFDLGGL
jgi:two-component system sensor histidine kinase PhcS